MEPRIFCSAPTTLNRQNLLKTKEIVFSINTSNSRLKTALIPRVRPYLTETEYEDTTEQTIWDTFFTARFPEPSVQGPTEPRTLFLIFDGLDEASAEAQDSVAKYVSEIIRKRLYIRILLTSRPRSELQTEESYLSGDVVRLHIQKEDIADDIADIAGARCRTLLRLSKFSKATKNKIRRAIKNKADGMLYVEHALRRLNYIGRETAVLRELQTMPESLTALYDVMIDECLRNRTEDQLRIFKTLEVKALVSKTVPEDSFDVEEELIGRLSRLLDLSSSQSWGEYMQDGEALFHDTEIDDDGEGLLEVGNDSDPDEARLGFQDRSLRDYFKAMNVDKQKLRTTPSAAHLTIFEDVTDIMAAAGEIGDHRESFSSTAKTGDDRGTLNLISYAVQFWTYHFTEIDLKSSSDDEVRRVVQKLYSITNNSSNYATTFELYALVDDCYPDSRSGKGWIHRMKPWTERAVSLPVEALDQHVRKWAQMTAESANRSLLPLAQAHVTNWYELDKRPRMTEAYRFARAALDVIACSEPLTTEGLDAEASTDAKMAFCYRKISQLDDCFPRANSHQARTARAVALLYYHQFFDISLADEAINILTESIAPTDDITQPDEMYTLWILAEAYEALQQRDKAVSTLDLALVKFLQHNVPSPTSLQSLKDISTYKATILWDQEKWSAAANAFEAARGIRPDSLPNSWELEMHAYAAVMHGGASEALGLFFHWKESERLECLSCIFYSPSSEILDGFEKGAKEQDKITFLLDTYTAFQRSVPVGTGPWLHVQARLADVYRNVVQPPNDRDARRAYDYICKTPMRDYFAGSADHIRCRAYLRLAELIFSDFRNCTDPDKKLQYLKEVGDLKANAPGCGNRESHFDILLALMQHAVSTPKEYQAQLDRTFNDCYKGLTDQLPLNDSDFFRLLSKVLVCVEGLEEDTKIALSCQFSVVDKALRDRQNSQVDDTIAGADVLEEQNESEKESNGQLPDGTLQSGQASRLRGTFNASKTGEISSNDSTAAEVTTKIITADDKANDGRNYDEMHDSPNEEVKLSDITRKGDNDTSSYANSLTTSGDEDICEDFSVYCDSCKRVIKRWTEPLYYCILCQSTDLCQGCYDKQIAEDQGGPPASWRRYCGKHHRYNKGPLRGWRGIKDGMIRIEGREDLAFTDWLEGLKNERWGKAWGEFWRRQGDVKGIV